MMISNPHIKRILCYGDSNTWGFIPGSGKRFSSDLRWTGILQQSLGKNFEIIEEGLNGRTTAFDRPDAEGKNGAAYLLSCLPSHYPIDIVILMLGTNDMKESLHKTPKQIATGIEKLLNIIENPEFHYDKEPQVILLSPPLIDESVSGVQDSHFGAEAKSKKLAAAYQIIAKKHNAHFINTAKFIKSSTTDGYHLDPVAQQKLADILTERIKKIYGHY